MEGNKKVFKSFDKYISQFSPEVGEILYWVLSRRQRNTSF